jgi:predicted phage-related endonuclease
MNDFRIYRLKRDMELEDAILSRCTEFWNRYVVGSEEPAIDGSDGCAQYLATKYPMNRLPLIGANEEAEQLLKDLFAIKDQVKSDEAIQTEYENRLKAIIGEAEGIQGICGKVLWRKNKDSEKVEWEAVARALSAPADLIAQHTIIKPGPRVFRPTASKR